MRHLLSVTLLLLSATAAFAGESVPARCASCHGQDGIAIDSDAPHVNGQLRGYLVDAISALAAGKRTTKVDAHVPDDLQRPQFDVIAEAWTSARAARPTESTDPLRVAEGRGIYADRCMGCHEKDGRNTDSRGIGAPLLAGQKISYLREQLNAYREGRRKYEVAMMGKAVSGRTGDVAGVAIGGGKGRLSAGDVEALAHFFAAAGLPPGETETRRRRR